MTDYKLLCSQLKSLSEGVDYDISVYSNASALLMSSLEDINWAGFYFIIHGKLRLGPFQGKAACTVIEPGKGVCGTAARKNVTLVVDNVHLFDGHIACDSASNSEIVIPLRNNSDVIGVMDIDSPSFSRFSEKDREGLESFAEVLESIIARSNSQ